MQEFNTLPNQVTLIRYFLIPLFIVISTISRTVAGMIMMIMIFTDFLDGYLARKLKQVTDFGSKLDSVADICSHLAIIAVLFMMFKDTILDYFSIGVIVALLLMFNRALSLMLHHRIAMIHLNSIKLTNVVFYVLAIYSMMFGFSNFLMTLYFVLLSIFFVEECLLILLGKIDNDIRSVFDCLN